jgi:PBP1b-binding outer membrane lipoprotein LpoB
MRTRDVSRPRLGLVAAVLLPTALFLGGCSIGSLDSAESVTPTATRSATSAVCADLAKIADDIGVLNNVNYTSGSSSQIKSDLESLSKNVKSYADAVDGKEKVATANLGLAAENLGDAVSNLGKTTTTGDVVTALSALTAAYDQAEVASDC